jgi:integrase
VKRRVKLGRYPAISLANARKQAAELLERVERGDDVVLTDRQTAAETERRKLTFADLVDEYLDERKGLSSLGEIERELKKDALSALGEKRPAEITPADIDSVARAIKGRGSEVMARRLIMIVKALYNFVLFDRPSIAARYGIDTNPADRLGRRRQGSSGGYAASAPRERALDDGEIVQWWRALNLSAMRTDTRIALKLVLATAQRPGEVRRARRADLHLDGREPFWLIPKEHSKKNGREHLVPVSSFVASLFREAIELSASRKLIFPKPNDNEEPIKKVARSEHRRRSSDPRRLP